MSISPERNDVDIAKLFTWGKEVSLKDDSGTELIKCYIRLVGDADLNRSRVNALRKSAELRKKLKDPDSDEHIAYVIEEDMVSKEQLIKGILILVGQEIGQRLQKEVVIQFPKELSSDATLEEEEKYQQEVDEYQLKVKKEISDRYEKEMKDQEKRLEKMPKKELHTIYVDYLMSDLCEKEMFEVFKLNCVVYGCYKDSEYKVRLFNSTEELNSLPSTVKMQLINEYSNLEMSMDFLKQSPGVTP
jgi:hypothetical protein